MDDHSSNTQALNNKKSGTKKILVFAIGWLILMALTSLSDRASYFWGIVLVGPAIGMLAWKDKVKHRIAKLFILVLGIILAVAAFITLLFQASPDI